MCQRGTREALNVTFRDARRFSLEAGGRERKEPMMLSPTCVLNARRGASPESFGHKDKRTAQASGLAPPAPVLGAHVKLPLKWFHLFSIRYDLLRLTEQSS